MKKTEISFLAKSCEGRLLGPTSEIENVTIDSRTATPGSLFICVKGENKDGHDFAKDAYERGCRAFLMSDEKKAKSILSFPATVILTDDTTEAFKKMATAYLGLFSPIKIAITGSTGKTTTRELTGAVLSQKYRCVWAKKNYNTLLGLCLTVFDIDEKTEVCVFEMGMDKKGEIESYCEWVRPDAALITNIGLSHLKTLGSKDAIFDAKLEITKYLKPGAPLFYIREGLLTEKNIEERTKRKDMALIPVWGFGDVKAHEEFSSRSCKKPYDRIFGRGPVVSFIKDLGEKGSEFILEAGENRLFATLPLLGRHSVKDAALAAAAGLWLGTDCPRIADAFSKMRPFPGRLNYIDIGGIMLIDDSYNATPESLTAGIEALLGVSAKRRVAVISDMLNLGSEEEKEHKKIGKLISKLGIDMALICGENSRYYEEGIKKEEPPKGKARTDVHIYDSPEELSNHLKDILKPGDAVLVKGSNATHISIAAEMIRKEFSKGQAGALEEESK